MVLHADRSLHVAAAIRGMLASLCWSGLVRGLSLGARARGSAQVFED